MPAWSDYTLCTQITFKSVVNYSTKWFFPVIPISYACMCPGMIIQYTVLTLDNQHAGNSLQVVSKCLYLYLYLYLCLYLICVEANSCGLVLGIPPVIDSCVRFCLSACPLLFGL